MKTVYKTHGVCSNYIDIETEDGIVRSVVFTGGCDGNLKGISRLLPGMSVDDVIKRFEGITCGRKNTSCPDQLAKALKMAPRPAVSEDSR